MTNPVALAPAAARRNAWFAYLGAAVALTGVQMISPALPIMRDALGLSEAQLSLVMSVYLLPAALAAIPMGVLADRIGRRIVFGGSFIGFGICGALLPVVAGSFQVFLGVRFVQGVMFAGLLPLTMTILGDAFSGPALIGAQGRRSVAMSMGDGLLPILGGLLVGAGWFVPWLGQIIAIPFGLAVLLSVVDPPALRSDKKSGTRFRDLGHVFKSLSIAALQYMGILRMFLKFSMLTFLPLFLVDVRAFSPAFAGLVIGVAALSGTSIALGAGKLALIGRPTAWITLGTVMMGASLISIVLVPSAALVLTTAVLYGAADGLMGVFTNSFVTSATIPKHRASFVAATGALRNFAKFLAPVVFGFLALGSSIRASFVLIGVFTVGSAALALALRPLEKRLMRGAST